MKLAHCLVCGRNVPIENGCFMVHLYDNLSTELCSNSDRKLPVMEVSK